MSSSPAKGRADYWKPGDWNVLCYQCGRKRKAGEVMRYWQGYWVCPEHWEPRQPQDFVRGIPDVQTPPWVQPPGTDGIPQLYYTVDDSASSFSIVVSAGTAVAVNSQLIVVIILEGVYLGSLDLTGVPGSFTVQVNLYGGLGGILGASNRVKITPTKKSVLDQSASTLVASPTGIAASPATATLTLTLVDTTGKAMSGKPVTLSSTGGTLGAASGTTNGSGVFTTTFGSATPGNYTITANVLGATLSTQVAVATLVAVSGTLPPSDTLIGLISGSFGSMGPSTIGGVAPNILGVAHYVSAPANDGFTILLPGLLAQNFFTSVTVNGVTLTTAAATYTQAFGNTVWVWLGSFPYNAAGSYGLSFT